MKVLQICQKPPLPTIDGGTLASYQLSMNILNSDTELKVLAMETQKHPFLPELIDQDYIINTGFETQFIDTHASIIAILINSLSHSSIQKKRFYHKAFSNKIVQALNEIEYDFVIFDGLMTSFYLEEVRQNSKAKIIYRSHNIEYNIFSQLAKNESNYFKAKYLAVQSKRLENVEKSFWQKVDQIWSISSFDSVIINKTLNRENKVKTLPFSMTIDQGKNTVQKNTLFHLGAMNWKPNIEGIKWFIKEVWPEVVHKIPSAKIHLGGKSIDNIKNKLQGENVIIHVSVINADEFYDQYEIMIVPVKSGSGIRIKLIQALSKGKIIITTKTGVMGIPAIHNEHLIICDSAVEMQDGLIRLMKDDALKEKLSLNAKKLFNDYFHIDKVTAQVKELLLTHN